MHVSYFRPGQRSALCLFIASALCHGLANAPPASAEQRLFTADDQYVQIEAVALPGESRTGFGIDVRLTPKPGWKLLAGNSSSINPLRLKFSPGQCLKLKGPIRQSTPDLSGTDDSGAYSEYFTQTASLRQEFSRLKCARKNGLEGVAALSYLLCQDNRCVGPFSKEFRFRAPEQN